MNENEIYQAVSQKYGEVATEPEKEHVFQWGPNSPKVSAILKRF